MRPFALLGLLLTLTACGNPIGNPTDGMSGFVGDTVTFRTNPNRPQADSDTARRAMGMPVDSAPILTAPGNIWPEMPKNQPPLSDVPPPANPLPVAMPVTPARPAPAAAPAANAVPAVTAPAVAAPGTRSLPTPQGNAVLDTGANGMISYTLPSGATGRAIDNGNGTMTLIGADGQVMTVPASR
jgi:hypothetical protein